MKDLVELITLSYGPKNFQPLGIDKMKDPILPKIRSKSEITDSLGTVLFLRRLRT